MNRISFSQLHTQRGRLAARRGLWEKAEQHFAAASLAAPTATNFYYLGNAQFKLEKFDQALSSTQQAIELDASNPLWHVRLGALYERAEKYNEAVDAYTNALSSDPHNNDWKKRVDRARREAAVRVAKTTSDQAIARLDKVAQSAVASNVPQTRLALLITASESDPKNPVIQFHLALSLLDAGQLERAVEHLKLALIADPGDAGLSFHLGWILRLAGRPVEAKRAFDAGIRSSSDPVFDRVGPGAYFHRQGLWEQAAVLYEERILEFPHIGDLHYRAGVARERAYDWQTAAAHHLAATTLDSKSPGRQFRLGMARERSSDLEGAVEAYRSAVRLDPQSRLEWQYRLAYCLHQVGSDEEAVEIFCKMSKVSTSELGDVVAAPQQDNAPSPNEADAHRTKLDLTLESHSVSELRKQGSVLMGLGMFTEAVVAWKAVVRQDDRQERADFFRLAEAYLACGDQNAALEAFLQVQKFRRPVDVGNHSYFSKPWQLNNMEYVEFSQACPLDESHVVFESYRGTKIDCNPAAIYRQLRDDPAYKDLRFTWVVNSQATVPDDVMKDHRVSLVGRRSVLYRKVLATAKYLVTNVSFPQYFVRREGQKYLNTWHGTPLKTLGKDLETGFMDHSNIGRNVLQTTHLLAPNDHTQDALIVRNEAGVFFTGKVGRLGTPRIDRMLNVDATRRQELFSQLGLPDDGRKVLFYAPTWRGDGRKKHFDTESLERDLRALANIDAHILFRAHHLTQRLLKGMALECVTVVSPEIDTYDVLGITDVLVTDYSSVFFDFLGASKPIVFYVYDLDDYLAERGLYFDMEDMPGTLAHDIEELTFHVERSLALGIKNVQKHQTSRLAFAPFEDGNASKRAVDFFFAEADEYAVEVPLGARSPLLIRHNFEPGAVTDEILARINDLTAEGRPVGVFFDKSDLRDRQDRREQLALLPEDVIRLARSGSHVVSLEERWNINQFLRSRRFLNAQQELVYRQAHEREFRRCIGTAPFGDVIQLSDLDPAGVSLVGAPESQIGNRHLLSRNASKSNQTPKPAPLNWYENIAPRVTDIL